MISVIIPTCDRPRPYLDEAMASVLAQTLAPHEVIVADNGNVPVEADTLPKSVELLSLPPRIGASRARNAGAAKATGSHLAFLDDDDFWDRSFLEEAWKVVEETGADCVYGRKDAWRDGKTSVYKIPDPDRLTIPVLLRENPGTGGMNLLISRELYERIGGFDENLAVSEDRALALEVLKAGGRIAAAPSAIAIMRVHDGERLRRNPIDRLSFIWKYRKLIGTGETLIRSASIILKAFRVWSRSKRV